MYTLAAVTPISVQILITVIVIVGMLLVSLALAALGVFLVSRAIRQQRAAAAAQQWPATPGTITAAEVRYSQTSSQEYSGSRRIGTRLNTTYHALVNYTYTVAGQLFTGDRIGFNEIRDSDVAKKVVQQYAPGAAVTVYYDPADPLDSVLDRTPPRQLGLLVFGVVVLAVSACCCVNAAWSVVSAAQRMLPR